MKKKFAKKDIELAKKILGINGPLYPEQKQCISRIEQGKDTLLIMSTGRGKSAGFQIPAFVTDGITLVITPLISIIDDQVAKLNKAIEKNGLSDKLCAMQLTSNTKEEDILRLGSDGKLAVRLLYTTPEALRRWEDKLEKMDKISLIAVDEVHCVSVWGRDFRPTYRAVCGFINRIRADGGGPPVAAFTATADDKITSDVINLLGLRMTDDDCIINTGGGLSDNITTHISAYKDREEKDAALVEYIRAHKGKKGIIFCMVKSDMYHVEKLLSKNKIKTALYYGGVNSDKARETRKEILESFISGKVKLMTATSAFGMGVDVNAGESEEGKSPADVEFIVHYSMPFTNNDYIQQCGRAGRSGIAAECEMFICPEDIKKAGNTIMRRDMLMFPISYCARVRKINRDEYCSFVEQCVDMLDSNSYAKEIRDSIRVLRLMTPWEDKKTGKNGYFITGPSSVTKKLIKDGRLTYFDSVIADGIYSLWYNERRAFSVRELAVIISGNINVTLSRKKRESIEESVDRLAANKLIPVRRPYDSEKKQGTDYIFTDEISTPQPWLFVLQNNTFFENGMSIYSTKLLYDMNEPVGKKGQRMEDTETFCFIKFFLLREIHRIKSINGSKNNRNILYCGRRSGSDTGLYRIWGLIGDDMSKPNIRSKNEYIHQCVSCVLGNLVRAKIIDGYSLLEADGEEKTEDYIKIGDKRIRGVKIELPFVKDND